MTKGSPHLSRHEDELPLSELRMSIGDVIARLEATGRIIYLTRRGVRVAILAPITNAGKSEASAT